MDVPDVTKAILIALTLLSYFPQYLRIVSRGNCYGVSPTYLLFNSLVATEQLTISLTFILSHDDMPDSAVRSPPTVGDWLNVAQFAVQWICASTLLFMYIFYPPGGLLRKLTILSAWISFVTATLVLTVAQFIEPLRDQLFAPYDIFRGILKGIQCYYVSPLCTAFAFLALLPQMRVTLLLGSPQALSPKTLLLQATIFVLLAVSWTRRFIYPDPPWPGPPFWAWYLEVGWAAVDSAIFAAVQGVVFSICRCPGGQGYGEEPATGEKQPLLG